MSVSYTLCHLLSSFMPTFPEVKTQNSGKQRLFFILKKFLALSQYNSDTVSKPTELTDISFPEPHPTIQFNIPVVFLSSSNQTLPVFPIQKRCVGSRIPPEPPDLCRSLDGPLQPLDYALNGTEPCA